MKKKYIPGLLYPDRRVTDKGEIIGFAKQYLKENSFIDLYWFIRNDMGYKDVPHSFVRDVAYKMVGSGNYEMAHTDYEQYFYLIKRKWLFRHPLVYGGIVALISGALALIVAIATRQDQSRLELRRETRQDSLLHNLNDSVNTLQKRISDSVAAIRSDSSLLNK
jgi:hypothetical protein